MSAAKRIVVIGSINMDLVVSMARMPDAGETILGERFLTAQGGKGANQAVAAAKLARDGTEVHFVGRVGDDDFGQRLMNGLTRHFVDTRHVIVSEGMVSGVAVILVDKKGENAIVVAQGANAALSARDIDAAEPIIASAAAVIVQLEIPLKTVMHTLAMCRRHGVFTILDPSPVPDGGLPPALYDVDILTPNQVEAEALLGIDEIQMKVAKKLEDPKQIASRLLSRGARAVVLKRGRRGALLLDRAGSIHTIKSHKVKVVDTTAAGDAFTAALAVARAEGMSLEQMANFANAAGAACCTEFGAQPALPSRDAVEQLLAEV